MHAGDSLASMHLFVARRCLLLSLRVVDGCSALGRGAVRTIGVNASARESVDQLHRLISRLPVRDKAESFRITALQIPVFIMNAHQRCVEGEGSALASVDSSHPHCRLVG